MLCLRCGKLLEAIRVSELSLLLDVVKPLNPLSSPTLFFVYDEEAKSVPEAAKSYRLGSPVMLVWKSSKLTSGRNGAPRFSSSFAEIPLERVLLNGG